MTCPALAEDGPAKRFHKLLLCEGAGAVSASEVILGRSLEQDLIMDFVTRVIE